MDNTVFELIIPEWHAAIPAEWSLEIASPAGEFEPAAGRIIRIPKGTRLRGGPESLIQGMLTQQFIQPVEA
jgi:hypothetical protein